MAKLKELYRKYRLLMFWTTAICFVIGLYFLILHKPFSTCNDQIFQYDVFYSEWYDLLTEFLKGNGLPLYSWELYLGSDFYSSMAYYCVGDIFVIILYPLYLLLGHLKYLLTLEIFLCIYVSSFWMYKLLEESGIRDSKILLFGALTYAFGGFVSTVYGEYMFHRFLAFLPMLFYGIEYFYHHKKTHIVVISVFILFLQNYYLMWPTSVFLLVYCLAKEFSSTKDKKRILMDAGHLLLAYFIGLALSAFLMIPAAISLLSNSRLLDTGNGGVFWPIKTYIGLLLSPIVSSFPMFTEINNIFYLEESDHSYRFAIFVGILFFIPAIRYVFKKENRPYLIAFLTLLTLLVFRPLCSLMNGLSVPSLRWTFLIELYLLMMGAKELDEKEKLNDGLFIIYFVFCLIGVGWLIANGIDVTEHLVHYISILVCLTMAFLIWFLYKKKPKIAIVSSVVLMVSYCYVSLYVKTANDYVSYERIDKEEVAYYDSLDSETVYRYFMSIDHITPYCTLNLNKAITYGFMSSKTYNSTYDNGTNTFNRLNGQYTHYIDITDPYALNMLGTKYWIVYNESELPSELHFEYSHPLADLQVYENLDYKGFSYTQTEIEYSDDFNDLSEFADTLFVDDENIDISAYDELNTAVFNITSRTNNCLCGNIDLNSDNILLVPIPNNAGWSVYVNGEKTETYDVNGGLMGIPLTKGYSEISMYFLSPGLKEGVLVSVIGTIACFLLVLSENRNRKKRKGNDRISVLRA